MRKLTIEMEPDEMFSEEMSSAFDKIESYQIIEALKINYEEGICLDLIEVTMKEGVPIEILDRIERMEIISVIRSDGRKHTCLGKYLEKEDRMESFRETDMDIIQTSPTIIYKDRIIVSLIGDNENLNKFIDMLKRNNSKILNISFKKATYDKHDILSVLTEKQRDVLTAAHKEGYYDYPKKINSEKLSHKVDLSKATLVQHLRKAEGRIMDEILTGQYTKK